MLNVSEGRAQFVARWAPRVGEEAADLSVTSARLVGYGGVLVPVWSVLFVAGHSVSLLIAIAAAIAALDAYLLSRGVMSLHRFYRLLSVRFGTRVWFLNSPSLREGPFQAWCQRHGVDPESGRSLGADIVKD
jgi:hypothetical protein